MKIIHRVCRVIKKQYLYLPVFWRKEVDIPFLHIGIRERLGILAAALWHLKNQNMRLKEYPNVIRKLYWDLQNRHTAEEKKIIFLIADSIQSRQIKIAKALQKEGYRIKLLCSSGTAQKADALESLKQYCETVQVYDTYTQLLYYIIESRVPLVHSFEEGGSYAMLAILLLLQVKGIVPKIVTEKYDIFSGMYVPKSTRRRAMKSRVEQYIMEHADGVCAREYALEYCERELHFRLRRNPLVFLDYAEKVDCFEQEEKKELSLCYVGGILPEKEFPKASWACILELAAMCEANECHLHIYPARWDEIRYSQYIQCDRDNPFFHFHKPVEFGALYEEISQYDYGIFPTKNTYLKYEIDGYITRNKIIYSSTNKLFDYMSAGIPIIAVCPVRLTEEIQKVGGILRRTIEEYDFNELRKRKTELRKEIIESREYWMMDHRIFELTDYYSAILKNS